MNHSSETAMRDAPVIIIGMHRSGTSLTVRLLRDLGISMGGIVLKNTEALNFQHLNRRIFAVAEGDWSTVEPVMTAMRNPDFVTQQTAAMRRAVFAGKVRVGRDVGLVSYIDHFLWRRMYRAGRRMWGWKDPRTTLTFPVWLRVFPQAKFVHVIRNGIDVAISLNRRTKVQQRSWWKRRMLEDYRPETLSFAQCFRLWELYLSFFFEQQELIPSAQILELRYEALLSEPEVQLRKLVDFLEYPVDATQITAVCTQIKQERLDNCARARLYQDEIAQLAGHPLMQALGYDYVFSTRDAPQEAA
ncbi:MAG: sulfotransferase [Anaerolineae bacterium]